MHTNAPLRVTLKAPDFPEDRRTGDAVTDVGILSDAIAHDVREALLANRPPLMVGGNCVHLTGQLAGLQAAYGAGVRVGLAFIDAHGDINTPYTTISVTGLARALSLSGAVLPATPPAETVPISRLGPDARHGPPGAQPVSSV